MKKSLVALAILGTFTGVASAATNVTLYGAVEVGYSDLFGKGEFAKGATPNVNGLSQTQAIVKGGVPALKMPGVVQNVDERPAPRGGGTCS